MDHLYRRPEPFIRLLIKVKITDFWEDGGKLSAEDREKLVTFGKLLANFRKLSGKT